MYESIDDGDPRSKKEGEGEICPRLVKYAKLEVERGRNMSQSGKKCQTLSRERESSDPGW